MLRFPGNNIRLMSDEELASWATDLISRKAPESHYLDYKAELSINTPSEKIEICKDITSFANTHGGILIYGVPEIKKDGLPIPEDISKCGISIPDNLPTKVEDILTDVVEPPLSEIYIKTIDLTKKSQKILLIYHPESYYKPHMVKGYKDGRYYCRGEYRSVIMNEKQVEAAYVYRNKSINSAKEFFQTLDLKECPYNGSIFRAIVCPGTYYDFKRLMFKERFRLWLSENKPADRYGNWFPFVNGWRFNAVPPGNINGKQYQVTIFHNGTIIFDFDLNNSAIQHELMNISSIEEKFEKMILKYSDIVFQHLMINNSVILKGLFYNTKGVRVTKYEHQWHSKEGVDVVKIDKNIIDFNEEMSVAELNLSKAMVLNRVMDRIASIFGLSRGAQKYS